jgi:hypothetical protein
MLVLGRELPDWLGFDLLLCIRKCTRELMEMFYIVSRVKRVRWNLVEELGV